MQNTKEKIKEILNHFKNNDRSQLIPILQQVQENFDFLSEEAMEEIGKFLSIPTSKVFGVATFYNQFRFSPLGKYQIQICRGTACHVEGSAKILEVLEQILDIKAGETTKDGMFSLEVVACIGACGLAPVMAVNGEFHAKLTTDSIKKIIAEYKKAENNNDQ